MLAAGGRVVSKETLAVTVWPNEAVGQGNLGRERDVNDAVARPDDASFAGRGAVRSEMRRSASTNDGPLDKRVCARHLAVT